MNAIEIGERLLSAAKAAADLLEKLEEKNNSFLSSSLGTLPDGTPFEDILEELKELKKDHTNLRRDFNTIYREAIGCNSATAFAAIKNIRELINKKNY